MNYDLAKRLKDAGFPHRYEKDIRECPDGHDHTDDGGNCAPPPTLSELIEACGKSFDCLYNCGDKGWGASHFALNIEDQYGSTPEEAVAELYLALNPKHND